MHTTSRGPAPGRNSPHPETSADPACLFEAADRRHVPLRAILVTAGVVVAI